jgi:hypothetical protein
MPPINYLAVLVTGVVVFVLGGPWFSLLFTKPWRQSGLIHHRGGHSFRLAVRDSIGNLAGAAFVHFETMA